MQRPPLAAKALLLTPVALGLALNAACTGEPAKPDKPACELADFNLADKTFVMIDAKPEGDTLNRKARARFYKDGDTLKVKYTVKSLVNVYDYTCNVDDKGRMRCLTDPDFERICLSLEAHKEGSCSADAIAKLGFEGEAGTVDEGMKKAKETLGKLKEAGTWEQQKIAFNNVANSVQGLLMVKVDEKKCRLQIDDLMVIVYNGATKRDYNPVGTNPFTKVDEDLLFTNCPLDGVFADHATGELSDPPQFDPPLTLRETGKPVHYFYLDDIDLEAKEGCTYSADTYANYLSVAKDVAIEAGEDGKLKWNAQHTWTDKDRMILAQGKKGGIFTMVRKKTCDGKTETIDAICNYTGF